MSTTLTPGAVKTVADEAAQIIAKLQELLPLDDDLLARDRKAANSRKGVPTAAIQAAATILEEIGEKGGGFSLDETREALAFESELGSVATKLRLLADRLEATINKRRSKAVATTGGLFHSLRGMARGDGTMVPYFERLAPHVRKARGKAAKASAPAPAEATTAPTTGNGHMVTAPSVTITPAGVTVDTSKPSA